MKRKIILYPDGKKYSIAQLEERLKFKYLFKNNFETPEDRAKVKAKGIQKLNSGNVTNESIDLGKKFAREIRGGGGGGTFPIFQSVLSMTK